MRGHLKKHKDEIDAERTVFINVDEVGSRHRPLHEPRGPLVPIASHSQLVDICEEIAEDDDDDEDTASARPSGYRTTSDGYSRPRRRHARRDHQLPGQARLHAEPSPPPQRIDDEALERAYEFCCELIERLDEKIGPDLAESDEETVLTRKRRAAASAGQRGEAVERLGVCKRVAARGTGRIGAQQDLLHGHLELLARQRARHLRHCDDGSGTCRGEQCSRMRRR